MKIRGATDRRWSVIRTVQSPRFGTRVICELTVKFNHHIVKVYQLHVFCLANWPIQTISDHSDEVESGLAHRFLCSAAAARTRRERERERERERRDSDIAFQTTPQRMDAYTQSYVKIPVLASILVNLRLYLKLTYTAENASAAQIRSEISAYAYNWNSMQLPDYSPLEVNDCLLLFVGDIGKVALGSCI